MVAYEPAAFNRIPGSIQFFGSKTPWACSVRSECELLQEQVTDTGAFKRYPGRCFIQGFSFYISSGGHHKVSILFLRAAGAIFRHSTENGAVVVMLGQNSCSPIQKVSEFCKVHHGTKIKLIY
jgi:hypothetical protein